ncbi:ATP-binding protein [Ferruginibacter paludis]|uniref:ATP-binding protein n=1 Tax=Ferruginibacter paludis TaxID=1310417 RepID=UPI0025B36145|nr:ATP-binding protein [Ferruginibacter paludis]MDN3654388.1 ATP-binding protein [Ferruginibacter paludis]
MNKQESIGAELVENTMEMHIYAAMMQSPVAIVILKGKNYTIDFVNTLYLQLLGKDNTIIGKPMFAVFPELQSTVIRELMDTVTQSGETKCISEQEFYILRNNKKEQLFFTCSYQPFKEKEGSITGVIIIFTEVTELVNSKNLNLLNQQKLAGELDIAWTKLSFKKAEKDRLAAALIIANNELAFQGNEKGKRAAELGIANIELAYQDDEKEKRAAELIIANKELAFQNDEKEKRAQELSIANKELIFQNNEKEKRAAELIIANKELAFQNDEKEKRAQELSIANKELIFQNNEKEKRAAELVIANKELAFQNDEKEKRAAELRIANYARSLIEASQDPLFTISTNGKITDMNNASVNITGASRELLTGSNFFDYFTEPEKAREAYERTFAVGFVADYPLTIRDHKLTDVLFNGSVYKDEQGHVQGVVIVARDVTAQKRIEEELIAAKVVAELATSTAREAQGNAEAATKIAENAVKAKQQFLSNMSHEIRTPMNAIIGFTKVVLKTDLSEKQKEYLNAIKISGDALIVLINDILDLAKVDAGKMSFEQIPFKLSVSIAAMLHLFEIKIQEKNLKLIKEYDSNIPEVLMGDPVRLHQIILNLVSNAVKFTTTGSITVGVRLLQEDYDTASVEFFVKDTGIGIREDKMEKIFENFQQASSGTSRLYGGTGLGLAIVKQLVEPQGGSITVKSVMGEGTTFSFILPFKKTKEVAEPLNEIAEFDDKIKNIRVLVVEDIALNQLLMRTLLDDFGFECDIAADGKIAIEKLENGVYDIILMDLQMPEMNGFEATDYIRKKMKLTLPIIALTADVTTVDVAKCREVGMNDYIAKPVNERLLYSKLIEQVKRNKVVSEEKVTSALHYEKCTDLEYLNRRTKSNPALMTEMILLYLEQTPPLISAMKQSFHDKNWQLLHSAVHKMIPSFSIMGISTDFENMARVIKEYAHTQQFRAGLPDMVLQLESVCVQACMELREELISIKNKSDECTK